ncbi:MAG TPA: DUF1801 domain-containing protein [Candidatus Saccharimonadales bacterium]|nr:DUF1801 domain-containing protein [Candidatus Saccharimonadales bacterium]
MRETIPPEPFLAAFPRPMAEIAQRLRGVVLGATPEALERVRPGWRLIGYDLPIGRRLVYFAYVAPEEAHVHLGFGHGWLMRDPDGNLQGRGITKRARWLTFRPGDPLDVPRLTALVHEAARVAGLPPIERVAAEFDAASEDA